MPLTPPTTIRTNLLTGYASSFWMAALALLLIPFYVRTLGLEAYGLIGFSITFQGLFSILDFGLKTTTNREFARLSATASPLAAQRDVLRTIETVSWAVALLNGVIVLLLARPIAEQWIRPEQLSTGLIRQAIVLMGLMLTLQWPLGLYSAGLLGLQRHAVLNTITIAIVTVRAVTTVTALLTIGATPLVFFSAQLLITAVHTAIVALALRRAVGGTSGSRFRRSVLTAVWRFAAGSVIISVTTTFLMQLDKLMVSKLLPLADLGSYTVAAAVALSLYRVISPLFTALFPRFSQLVAAGDEAAVTALYHRSVEALSVITLPVAIFLALFSREVLYIWTRDRAIADATHLIMTTLVLGTALSGLTNIPYALQLAYGLTRLLVRYNVAAIAVLIPLVYLLTREWGGPGASLGWLTFNVGGFVLIPWLMHRRLLKGELVAFYRDIGVPLAAAVLTLGTARVLLADVIMLPTISLVFWLALAAVIAQLATVAAARSTRLWIRSLLPGTLVAPR